MDTDLILTEVEWRASFCWAFHKYNFNDKLYHALILPNSFDTLDYQLVIHQYNQLPMHHSSVRKNNMVSPEDENPNEDKGFQRTNPMAVRSYTNIHKKATGSVSFNIGRVIPRNINQDKESLYAENFRLKEENKELRDANTKLKTRVNVSEKQKEVIFENLSFSNVGLPRSGSRSLPRNSSNVSIQKQSFLKKMLRETKEELEKVKKQNALIKKSNKYTQISQLNIQIEEFGQECHRLKNVLQSGVLVNNAEEIEAELHNLRADLRLEKESTKTLIMQIKRKTDQFEKIRESDQKKIKQLNKEIYLLKHDRKNGKGGIIPLSNEYVEKARNLSAKSLVDEPCKKCFKLSEQIKDSQRQVKELTERLNQNKPESVQSQQDEYISNSKPQKLFEKIGDEELEHKSKGPSSDKKQKKYESQTKKTEKTPQQNRQVKNKSRIIQKQIEKQHFEEYEEEFQEQIPNQIQENKNMKKKEQVEEYAIEDYDDDFEEAKEPIKAKDQSKSAKKREEQIQNAYADEFQEEVVTDPNDQEYKILKETITYKFKSQRYEYSDLIGDIQNSGVKELKIEDIANILNNEPFLLNEDQIITIIEYIKEHNHSIQSIKASNFTNKIKDFIGDFTLLPEEKQEKLEREIKQKLQKNKNKLKKQFEKYNKKEITKEEFTKVLRSNNFNPQLIDIAIGQSALVSTDIQHINYGKFIIGVLESEE